MWLSSRPSSTLAQVLMFHKSLKPLGFLAGHQVLSPAGGPLQELAGILVHLSGRAPRLHATGPAARFAPRLESKPQWRERRDCFPKPPRHCAKTQNTWLASPGYRGIVPQTRLWIAASTRSELEPGFRQRDRIGPRQKVSRSGSRDRRPGSRRSQKCGIRSADAVPWEWDLATQSSDRRYSVAHPQRKVPRLPEWGRLLCNGGKFRSSSDLPAWARDLD